MKKSRAKTNSVVSKMPLRWNSKNFTWFSDKYFIRTKTISSSSNSTRDGVDPSVEIPNEVPNS